VRAIENINVISNLAPDSLDLLVEQHLGYEKRRSTVLIEESKLGCYAARITRVHHLLPWLLALKAM